MEIKRYLHSDEEIWDDFILSNSINGTFLQSRNFLNYHPEGRFEDCSLIIQDKNKIIAIIPACTIYDQNEKIFYSHKGSTFGGIVVSKSAYDTETLLNIIGQFEEYLIKEDYNKIILKITSDLFSKENGSLLEYCLHNKSFNECKELSAYIDFSSYNENIVSNFAQGKRTNYNNCVKQNMICKKIICDKDIEGFYNLLCDNLRKYSTKPVHSFKEILDLRSRLETEISFWGCYLKNELLAASMMFHFNSTLCAHAQYLCSDQKYNKLSPMTFMYYSMIEKMKDLGYKKLSWGIATENMGKEINIGLIKAKESYGSKYCINRTFIKNI